MNIFDNFNEQYKSPFGAVKVNETITIRIKVESYKRVYNPCLLVCLIDEWSKLTCYNMSYECEKDGFKWYSVNFSIPEIGTYFYFMRLNIDGCEYEIRRGVNCHRVLVTDRRGGLFQITVYDNKCIIGKDYKGGIYYQIFPDRFCNSGEEKKDVPSDRIIRKDWGGIPEYLPNSKGEVLNNDYFCGDIQGIINKLPYLKSLGVTVIYLNPIFLANSNHRYDTSDYMTIDMLLGTFENFKELCKKAKEMCIGIVLDGVLSHTGDDSIYFNRYCRYNSVGAYNSKESEYYSWYKFEQYPNEYRSWWGFKTLPELDKYNESYIKFICGDNGVIHKWLEAGAIGFRLDVADELPPEFLDSIKEAVIKYGGKILIGEVWEDASVKRGYGGARKYLHGKQLDSIMNYPFQTAILEYIRYGNCVQFNETVMSIVENYPKDVLDCLMNMLSTHDTERAMTKLVGEEAKNHDRNWKAYRNTLVGEQYEYGKKLLKLAVTIQYFLPGMPMIYYGEEAGLHGYNDPFNRGCYPWGNEDTELIEYYKELGKIRLANDVLKDGMFKIIAIDRDFLVFERYNENESIIIGINRTNSPKNISFIEFVTGRIGFNSELTSEDTDVVRTIPQYEAIGVSGQCYHNIDELFLDGYSSAIFRRIKRK